MTATVTPRLGLLLPASSDNFLISDFDSTMTILDNTPGVTPVGALPPVSGSGALTTAQDGSLYLLKGDSSLWRWSKPGSSTGTWIKINSKGALSMGSGSGSLKVSTSSASTSTTTPGGGPDIINTTFVYPSGRSILLGFECNDVANTGSYGIGVTEMFVNGTSTGSFFECSAGGPGILASHRISYLLTPGEYGISSAGSSVRVQIKIRSSSYGGTTSVGTDGTLYAIEV